MNQGTERTGARLFFDRNLLIIFGVTLTVVMGVSSVAPAFPKMIERLDLSPAQVGLVVTAFTLPGIFLTPVLGVLADRLGRKRVLAPSLLAFAVFGGACGFVDDFGLLLFFRVLQGVGAAALGALNITILSDLFSGRERIAALGYNAGVLSLGTTIYPAVGGGLAMLGWHFPFFLPFAVLPLAWLVLTRLQSPRPDASGQFKEYMLRAARLAASKRAIGLFGTTVVTFIILYGLLITYLPVYLAQRFDALPWQIGAVMSAASLATALMASQLRRVANRMSTRTMIVTAFLLYGLSAALLPLMPGLWLAILPACVFGMAQGLNVPSIQTMMAELAPMELRGAFMALNGMVLRIGQTLGPVLMGAAFAVWGMAGVFGLSVGLAVVTVVFVAVLVR
jgi:MFS family permease